MSATTIARQRLANQQIAGPRFRTPAELVRWMGAVQAQDYRGALWAVGLRLPDTVESDVEEALAARTLVRTWPMRGTLHLVAAEDVRWMLRLLTPRVLARSAGRYRELELDDAAFAKARRILVRALGREGQLTRQEAYAALERGGVPPAGQRGIHILGHLAQQGLLCLGARRERQHTFVLLDAWVPAAAEPPREQALATLATRYFASHGPATLRDFAWWSGLLVKDAQAAIAEAGSALTGDGRTWGGAAAVPAARGRRPVAALLPPWDEYVVAYQDRDLAVGHLDNHDQDRLKTVGSALLVIDGRVRGAWRRELAASRVRLTVDFWTPVSGADRRAVDKAAARYGRFLGKDVSLAAG